MLVLVLVLVIVLVFDLLARAEKGIRSSRSDPPLWWRDICVLEHEQEHEHESELSLNSEMDG